MTKQWTNPYYMNIAGQTLVKKDNIARVTRKFQKDGKVKATIHYNDGGSDEITFKSARSFGAWQRMLFFKPGRKKNGFRKTGFQKTQYKKRSWNHRKNRQNFNFDHV